MKMKSMKRKGKLIDETVGHLPKELSRAVQFFLEQGGKISRNVFEQKYWPSPIPKGELEIKLEVDEEDHLVDDEDNEVICLDSV